MVGISIGLGLGSVVLNQGGASDPYGPNLITIGGGAIQNANSSTGTYDGATGVLTSGGTSTNNTFPRVRWLGVLEAGKTYFVEVTTTGDQSIGRAGGNNTVNAVGMSINGTFVANVTTFFIAFDGTAVFSTTITSVSLREVL